MKTYYVSVSVNNHTGFVILENDEIKEDNFKEFQDHVWEEVVNKYKVDLSIYNTLECLYIIAWSEIK